MEEGDEKRLFLGVHVVGSWPPSFPSGKLIEEEMRHITLAFFGVTSFSRLSSLLPSMPKPPFPMGLGGVGDHIEFFSHVVATHVTWLEEDDLLKNSLLKQEDSSRIQGIDQLMPALPTPEGMELRLGRSFMEYYTLVQAWLKANGYPTDTRPYNPHITLARQPFSFHEWKQFSSPIPFYATGIYLYESLGHSHYKPLWEIPLPAPFEEIEHTADIAFLVQGVTLRQLLLHGYLALAFKFPSLLSEKISDEPIDSLDDVIIALNDVIGRADQTIGVPFKAVSFHGEHRDNQWIMIVDV